MAITSAKIHGTTSAIKQQEAITSALNKTITSVLKYDNNISQKQAITSA